MADIAIAEDWANHVGNITSIPSQDGKLKMVISNFSGTDRTVTYNSAKSALDFCAIGSGVGSNLALSYDNANSLIKSMTFNYTVSISTYRMVWNDPEADILSGTLISVNSGNGSNSVGVYPRASVYGIGDPAPHLYLTSFTLTCYVAPYLRITSPNGEVSDSDVTAKPTADITVGQAATFKFSVCYFASHLQEPTYSANKSDNVTLQHSDDYSTWTVTQTSAGAGEFSIMMSDGASWGTNFILNGVARASSVSAAKSAYVADGYVGVSGIVYAEYAGGFFIADSDGTGLYVSPCNEADFSSVAIGDQVNVSGYYGTKNGGIGALLFDLSYSINEAQFGGIVSSNNSVTPQSFNSETVNGLTASSTNADVLPLSGNYVQVVGKRSASHMDSTPTLETGTASNYDLYDMDAASYIGMIAGPSNFDADQLADYLLERDSYTIDSSVVTFAGPSCFEVSSQFYNADAEGAEYSQKLLPGIMLTPGSTYSSEASSFAKSFLASTAVCDASGVSDNVSSLWPGFRSSYAELTASAQSDLKLATAKTDGAMIAKFAARYDFIAKKYSLSDFATRTSGSQSSASVTANESLDEALISIIALSLCLGASGCLFYRRKRKNGKSI